MRGSIRTKKPGRVGFVNGRWLFVLVIGVGVCDAVAADDPVRHDVKKGKPDSWLTYSSYAHGYRLKHPPDWKPHVFKTRDSEFLYFFETADYGIVTFVIESDTTSRDAREAFERRRPALQAVESSTYFLHLATVTPDYVRIPMQGDGAYQETVILRTLGDTVLWIRLRTSGVEDIVWDILGSITEIDESAVTTLTIHPATVHVGEPFEIEIRVRNTGRDTIQLSSGNLCQFSLEFAGRVERECSDLGTHLVIAPGNTVCQRFRLRPSLSDAQIESVPTANCDSPDEAGGLARWPTAFGKIATGVYEFRGGLQGRGLRFPYGSATVTVIE